MQVAAGPGLNLDSDGKLAARVLREQVRALGVAQRRRDEPFMLR
jgi:hypothetical protein